MSIFCGRSPIFSLLVVDMQKRNKYNVDTSGKGIKRRTFEDVVYDSELECRYYKEVISIGLASGEIIKCKRQVPYELQPKFEKDGKKYQSIKYVADFVVTYANGEEIVIDVKGDPDRVSRLKKKMFDYIYPDIKYIWIGYCKHLGGWLEYSELEKLKRLERKNKKSITPTCRSRSL